eukprot:TRINITY_DN38868_c0_g1_i1.p1 TRINITY_DN38868_c0_g1~~TRINITY_DN38868_c0_g1_i1.p1  ORF type:complete len:322 (-),score=53.62 TRINITY_DN38868_c0_g1_i1:282-1247(-)
MAGFATAVASLRAAQGLGAVASAGASVKAIGGSSQAAGASASSSFAETLHGGMGRAKGVLQSIKTKATGQHRSLPLASPAADGSCCEVCGQTFGLLRRRRTCSSCDRFLCTSCMSGGMTLISCLCASSCERCTDQNSRSGEFEIHRADMESGVSATLALPGSKVSGFFAAATGNTSGRKLAVWLSIDCGPADVCWHTLEQRGGRPSEEGRISVCEILSVRDTGVVVELSIKGQTQATVIEFGTPSDLSSWSRYLELAVEVLTPESERAALDAARAEHRRGEMEERRHANEERRKKLSENLGMRFTAEAMLARGEPMKLGRS